MNAVATAMTRALSTKFRTKPTTAGFCLGSASAILGVTGVRMNVAARQAAVRAAAKRTRSWPIDVDGHSTTTAIAV